MSKQPQKAAPVGVGAQDGRGRIVRTAANVVHVRFDRVCPPPRPEIMAGPGWYHQAAIEDEWAGPTKRQS